MDGRSEIIGQVSGFVYVIESSDELSLPSQLVWSSPYLSNILGIPTIGDTDRDGRMEILQSVNGTGSTSSLAIFENSGDNAFTFVFNGILSGPSSAGEKLIADLDGDGRLEIALCGSPGWLHVFESPCNDVWILTSREWTGLYNAYTIDGGRDTDLNGKREIFVMGTLFTDSLAYYSTVIYESTGDNSFSPQETIILGEGVGVGSSAMCNVDAVGEEEYLAIDPGVGIRVFHAHVPGTWGLVGTVFGPGGIVHAFDLNRNGLPEVIWLYFTTRIFEHPGTTTNPTSPPSLQARLDIVPNPCRTQVSLRFSHREIDMTFIAYDIRGRLVERRRGTAPAPPFSGSLKIFPLAYISCISRTVAAVCSRAAGQRSFTEVHLCVYSATSVVLR